MKAKRVLGHIFIALVLYNIMALGSNQMMETGGGVMWMICGLGGAFGLGFQLRGFWIND
jgi:hypothetical protein